MAILVTGGSGFVGLNVIEALLVRGEPVVALSDRPVPEQAARRFAALPGRFACVTADVRDAPALAATIREHGVTRIVHGAAITPDERREATTPSLILEVNVLGLVRLLEVARDAPVRRIVLISSAAAYGRRRWGDASLSEELDGSPDTLYAISKAAAEQVLWRLAGLYGLSCVAARLGTVFGPWEWATGWRDTLSPILQVTALARQGRPAALPHDDRRDWLYSRDAATALLRLLDAARPRHPLYNLGSGSFWSLSDWCRRLSDRHPRFVWAVGASAAGTPVRCHTTGVPAELGNARFAREFDPPATYDLDRAFDDYLSWLDTVGEPMLPSFAHSS